MAETGVRKDPFRNYNFLIEIDSIVQAGFAECSGLEASIETIRFREGGDQLTERKLPGRTTYSDIVLRRGVTDSTELWQWFYENARGRLDRRNGSIVVFDIANQEEVARWNFVQAWPNKWEGPSFNASGNEVAIEALTIAHEGIERA